MARKLNAAQRKQVAALVEAAKKSDGKVKWHDLYNAEEAAWNVNDGGQALAVACEVLDQLRDWSADCQDRYNKIARDVVEVEHRVREASWGDYLYLQDSAVDEENVLEHADRSVDSVDFWQAMLWAQGPAIGDRADAAGIRINDELGYSIY
jgi:hypothetical protein